MLVIFYNDSKRHKVITTIIISFLCIAPDIDMFAQDEPPREQEERGFKEVSGFKEVPEASSRLSEEEVMPLKYFEHYFWKHDVFVMVYCLELKVVTNYVTLP